MRYGESAYRKPQESWWLVLLRIAALMLIVTGCSGNLPRTEQPMETAMTSSQTRYLAGLLARTRPDQGPLSGYYVLDAGNEALRARLAMADAAEQSIDAQYYIWNNDQSGRYLAGRLLLAADRGVQVRLLLDDINVTGVSGLMTSLDNHPAIDVRIFNPSDRREGVGRWISVIGDFQRMNRRMHNKTFVADGVAGIVGGRNIGDEYFGLHRQRYFVDRDVLALGPIVAGMTDSFDAYWNSHWSFPVSELYPPSENGDSVRAELEALRSLAREPSAFPMPVPDSVEAARLEMKQLASLLEWAEGELVYDPPADSMESPADTPKKTARALYELASAAKQEILIESAYLVLATEQLEKLAGLPAADRLRIVALTNSLASNDLVTNHSAYARWRPEMLEHGMTLYELNPEAPACRQWLRAESFCDDGQVSLHSKSVIIDREVLAIGSFNVNLRSIYLNGETVLIIHSPELAGELADKLEAVIKPWNSWQVTLDDQGREVWQGADGQFHQEPTVGWWRRLMSSMLSLLPIEKYL